VWYTVVVYFEIFSQYLPEENAKRKEYFRQSAGFRTYVPELSNLIVCDFGFAKWIPRIKFFGSTSLIGDQFRRFFGTDIW
jgi:hypothetical protein